MKTETVENGSSRKHETYKKGLWTAEEDRILTDYIGVHGKGKWNRVTKLTGLKRCGKSCRLRWMNYLSPTVKRGDFSEEENDLIIRLHKLLGNRWSLIAGRVPGRTDNQVKNHWNSHLSKKLGVINNNFKGSKSKAARSTSTTSLVDQEENPKGESNSGKLQQQQQLPQSTNSSSAEEYTASTAAAGLPGRDDDDQEMWEAIMMGSSGNYGESSFWFYNNNEEDLNQYHSNNCFMDPSSTLTLLDHQHPHHDYPFQFLDDIDF